MTKVKQLKRDVETLNRALNLGPEPKWKKRSEEIRRGLTNIKRVEDAFAQLSPEEQERHLQELRGFPATDFVHGSPELQMYAEAIKSATIRNLISAKHARRLDE